MIQNEICKHSAYRCLQKYKTRYLFGTCALLACSFAIASAVSNAQKILLSEKYLTNSLASSDSAFLPASEPDMAASAPAAKKAKKHHKAAKKATAGAEPSPASTQIPTREFIVGNISPEIGFGAYGYVLLTSRPGSSIEVDRYKLFCNAYLQALEPNEAYPDTPKSDLMPTFWMLQTKADEGNCNELVEKFDFARAKKFLSMTYRLSGRGPILASWLHDPEKSPHSDTALILDLSNFSDEDMKRAIGIWMGNISNNSSLFKGSFAIVKIREEFRSLLNTYGTEVIKVIGKNS